MRPAACVGKCWLGGGAEVVGGADDVTVLIEEGHRFGFQQDRVPVAALDAEGHLDGTAFADGQLDWALCGLERCAVGRERLVAAELWEIRLPGGVGQAEQLGRARVVEGHGSVGARYHDSVTPDLL